MGSTIIYEQVKGTAKYSVSFGGNPSSISNQEIKEPLTAYNIARELQQRGGFNSRPIRRLVYYSSSL